MLVLASYSFTFFSFILFILEIKKIIQINFAISYMEIQIIKVLIKLYMISNYIYFYSVAISINYTRAKLKVFAQ